MNVEARKRLARLRGQGGGGNEVLEYFTVLRERLKSGLRRVMEINRKHPHFVAALIMVVGCEAVGKLLSGVDGKKRDAVFVHDLVLPHKRVNAAMARDLFRAIRHGIAHSFYPKPIVLRDDHWLHVIVNWGTRRPHLTLWPGAPPAIWLDLSTMQEDFEAMLDRYREELVKRSLPGRRLSDRWVLETMEMATKESEPGWQAFLDQGRS